jgi:GAF domain-containing protein
MGSRDILEISRRLRAALTPGDLDHTLGEITAAAVDVLPDVQYASITVKHADGRLETAAPTDRLICDVDAKQYQLQQGPCYEAAVDAVHVTAPRLATDSRWPEYAAAAVSAGIQAQAGIRLFDAKASNGALNLYSQREGAFADLDGLHELFSHQAGMAIDFARHIDQLQQAIETRQLIGEAVGVVMERFQLDDARAFGFLTRLSQNENIKLKVVAEQLVDQVREQAAGSSS